MHVGKSVHKCDCQNCKMASKCIWTHNMKKVKFVIGVKARKSCRESWGMTIATREWRWISLQMWLPKLWNDFTHVTQLLWKYWESLYKIAFCNNISRFYNMIDGYVSLIVPRKISIVQHLKNLPFRWTLIRGYWWYILNQMKYTWKGK